ncbi:6-carboxytetrahydropterin synthase [Kitasatospora sp. NPDC127121]|uniref:6-carboxytetrahydropterin synthase n=1 Tax=Kitasatospora sp. NPDC127121 TaxID=3345371 RepID=UPI00362B1D8E
MPHSSPPLDRSPAGRLNKPVIPRRRPIGTYAIGKRAKFEAARTVNRADASDSLTAELTLTAHELTGPGFVCDFGDLAAFQRHIEAALDHQDLDTLLADVTDAGIAGHLHRWAAANLPVGARGRLSEVRILTGRPSSPPDPEAVHFRARHWLRGLPVGHKCARPHGHAYLITLPTGPNHGQHLPIPAQLRAHLMAAFHGQVLNDVLPDLNPTSENLAAHLADLLSARGLSGPTGRPYTVRVSETETTWAQFTPDAGAAA